MNQLRMVIKLKHYLNKLRKTNAKEKWIDVKSIFFSDYIYTEHAEIRQLSFGDYLTSSIGEKLTEGLERRKTNGGNITFMETKRAHLT